MIELVFEKLKAEKRFTSKAGNPVVLTPLYVHIPNNPYPIEVDFFGEFNLPKGKFKVSCDISSDNGLKLVPDLHNTKPA